MAVENTATSNSLLTEDGYSFITNPSQGPTSRMVFPNKPDLAPLLGGNGDLNSSPIKNGCAADNDHLFVSHHALETAYEHMKRRLSEAELINKSLNRRIKFLSNERSPATSELMSTCHEIEVTKVWDAYSDKCRECEKLRDDLQTAEQNALKVQNAMRGLSNRDDVMKVQAQRDELRKKLQQTELEIRDHKSREEMAREELQKEKEFHEMVLRETEERHHKMQNTITSLEQELNDQKRLHQQLNVDLVGQKQLTQELLTKKDAQHKEEMDEMEGKIIREQEERSRLEKQVMELENWKKEILQVHLSSGVPLSLAGVQQHRGDGDDMEAGSDSSCSETDAAELVSELHSLTEELVILKQQTSLQSAMLSKICQDPKIQQSILSMNYNGFRDADLNSDNQLIQCCEVTALSESTSIGSSIDTRQVLEDSPASSFGLTATDVVVRISPLAVSRQVRNDDDTVGRTSGRNSPQQIDIPAPETVNTAFSNIQITTPSDDLLDPVSADEFGENPSSYYTTVTGDPNNRLVTPDQSGHSRGQSISSDSGTGSSNVDTLVLSNSPFENSEAEHKRPSPVEINEEELLQHNIAAKPSQHMQAIWPSSSGDVAGPSLMPMWPSGTGSGPNTSFEVISHLTPSNYDPLNGRITPTFTRGSTPRELGEVIRELVAQQPVQPISLDLPVPTDTTLPPPHLSSRPSNWVGSNNVTNPNDMTIVVPEEMGTRGALVEDGSVAVVDLDTKAREIPRSCPVCYEAFNEDATQSFMQRHINGHFSGEEDTELFM